MKLKDAKHSSDQTYLAEVDWEQTQAYSIGLAGIFVNQKGREGQGIVARGSETASLVKELCQKLTGLHDDEKDCLAIRQAVASGDVYQGPYTEAAPDVIIGYNVGYRVSWDAAVGKTGAEIFEDNVKAWSGDHCIHPDLVPGILFSNVPLRDGPANIIDMAPTTLDLLGVDKPAYMEGSSLHE